MVLDEDALALLCARGHVLQTLRLDKCLRTLFLEESNIMDHDGEWLQKLAINNSVLETLNFYMTDLLLVSLKTSDHDVSELDGFSQTANALQEFGGGSFTEQRNVQVRVVLGDRGLETVAQKCKKLRRLRIEWSENEHGLEDEQGKVSHVGLSSVALTCSELEYLVVYASGIMNTTLDCFRMYGKKLCNFCFVLLDREERIADLPLDNDVWSLLSGCNNLQRSSLYLRTGGLSDVGLGYIGEYSGSIRYMLLGNVGDSDGGLLQFARACSNFQKLELRSCCFGPCCTALHLL
uniref:PH01B015M02.17 protein n=1 Tax=Phyllostachys edulis TaxID=38705 RepID=L0P1S2_PHYED|nr:PH01B015M02.17 [Phyllostachys edulis]